jgi:hypothetical protein
VFDAPIAGIVVVSQIEPMIFDLLRVMLPRVERRLCRRDDSWGKVRKGGKPPAEQQEGGHTHVVRITHTDDAVEESGPARTE